ncbi:MAG: hypothetical protein ABIQ31_24570 [Ferruginibacter sp.]
MLKYLFILLIIATSAACKKSQPIGEDEYVTLQYKQTSCADVWTSAPTDSATLKNVAAYLNSLNLYIASLNIKKVYTADACDACHCKTGKVIYVSTLNSDSLKAKYGRIGFVK